LHNCVFPGAFILGYHRVVGVEIDSFYDCVSPENFDQQMEVLRKHTNLVHLSELVAQLEEGTLLPKTVCVTIADGYADALTNAKPILEKHNFPATVFVTTGNLGGEFWWDEVERYILSLPEQKGKLSLRVRNRISEWDFSNADRAGRIAAIANLLRPLDAKHCRQLLNEIREWAGDPSARQDHPARSMTADELVTLVDNDIVNIGSRSISHPVLPT
jgi:peptidoglycan/xylan/chitin deacetylase (PgdA/CDA1 family)